MSSDAVYSSAGICNVNMTAPLQILGPIPQAMEVKLCKYPNSDITQESVFEISKIRESLLEHLCQLQTKLGICQNFIWVFEKVLAVVVVAFTLAVVFTP